MALAVTVADEIKTSVELGTGVGIVAEVALSSNLRTLDADHPFPVTVTRLGSRLPGVAAR